MKILYLITKSEIGGAQVHVRDLMKHTISKGYTVALISPPEGWLSDEAKKIGVQTYPNAYSANSFSPVNIVGTILHIKKTVRNFDPDIVHCHSSVAGFLGRIAIRNKVTTIFTAHGWAFTEGTSWFKKTCAFVAEKIAARYAKKIICVSEHDRQYALRLNLTKAERLITIHNGIPLLQKLPARLENNIVKIITVGRLTHQKDHRLLIAAYADLPESILAKTQLHIIGDGPEKNLIVRTIKSYDLEKYVRVVSDVIGDGVNSLLLESDIFILISRYEGLPITVLEAMNAGLPVVASRTGGIPEEIDDTCGILIEKNSKEKITQALCELITSKEKRIVLGTAGHKKVQRSFSLGEFLEKTEGVYKETVSH